MKNEWIEGYRNYGKKILANLKDRDVLYDLIRRDPKSLADEKVRALGDIFHFFEYHAWTHEPRPRILELYGFSRPSIPFLLYDFQKETVQELVDSITQGRDVLIEKSRDMGVSWLVVTVFLWFWLQQKAGNDFLFGSRKLDYVDRRGAQDTLFEKFRYNLYRSHIKPIGFKTNDHDNVAFISNPETGSFIRGESNNANFGTSGRYKAALLDEFAKWEETDADAWTSMGDSSPCRVPVSTPWGIGRKFAQLRFSGACKVLTLHWSRHPMKALGLYKDPEGKMRSDWYDAECERRKDDPAANVGQELDIDYLKSGTPYFNNSDIQKRFIHLTRNPPKVERYSFQRTDNDDIEIFPSENGLIYVMDPPDTQRTYKYRYCISCDVGEGLEKSDNSTFYVYDRLMNKDVAWYVGKPDTSVLALLLVYMAYWYDEAYIAVEKNNHGHAVNQDLKRLEYQYLYTMGVFSDYSNLESTKLGWHTNVSTRPIMCATLRNAVSQGVDGIYEKEAFNEMMTFIYNKNGKPEAEIGCLDDRVMAQAIKFMLHEWLPAPIGEEPKDKFAGKVPFGLEIKQQKDVREFW